MAKTLDDFFKENETRIGKDRDFEVKPPLYYYSLNDAFYNYYRVVRENKDTYHDILDFGAMGQKSFGSTIHDYRSAIFAILGFHRFFELLLKDILGRINPFLAVKFPDKKEEIRFYNNELNSEELESVEFGKAYSRFKEAVNYYDKNPDKSEYYIAKKFSFLIEGETLNRLSVWRNRIMHNGTTLPNIYLMDYLVSQKIIPLVLSVVEIDKNNLNDKLPLFFTTLTGINIVEEIKKIQFEYGDFYNQQKHTELRKKIVHLAHLKELGRATYSIYDNYGFTVKRRQSYHERYYEDPIGRIERFVEMEKDQKGFYDIKKCPCCGFKTLVVYRMEYEELLTKKIEVLSWFNCFTCTYGLRNNIGDPMDFGYSEEKLFPVK